MEHNKPGTLVEQFETFMQRDTRAVQILSYGIASAGLIIALYRIRPFAKFSKPSSIPAHFLREKIPLRGTVQLIEPKGGVLMVQHKPLLPIPRLSSKEYLPVKIAGVNVTSNGVQWLQFIVNGKQITFIPLMEENGCLSSIVILPQKDQGNLKIGEELVKLGFGTSCEFQSILLEDKYILTYWTSLLKAQKWAKWYRKGHWQFVKPPTVLWKFQMSCVGKVKSVLPKFVARYMNT